MSGDPSVPAPLTELLANRDWVRALARSLTRDRSEADDVEQDALATALVHPPEGGRPLRPWLARVVTNLARKRLRSERRRAAREQDSQRALPLPSPEELVERVATQRHVVEAVMELEEPYRSTLLLRYYEDLSSVEIARRQGIPAATVRQRIKRGLARLRARLQSRYGGRHDALEARLLLLELPALAPTRWFSVLLMKKALVLLLALSLTGFWIFRSSLSAPGVQGQASARPSVVERANEGAVPGHPDGSLAETPTPPALRSQRSAVEAPHAVPPPTGTLLVRVERLDDAAPIAGEVVTVRRVDAGSGLSEDFVLRTDDRGEARRAGLEPGELRLGSVRSSDEAVWVRIEPQVEVEATLRVQAGLHVDGHVSDASGRGIPGAEVWISEPWDRLRGHSLTLTNEHGDFAIEEAQAFGHNWIGARAPGLARSRWHYFEGRPGERIELRIVLDRPGAEVTGVVVDERGAPVAGAGLLLGIESPDQVASPSGSPPDRTRTLADGTFWFGSVPSGPLPLLVRAPGFGCHQGVIETAGAPRCELRIVLLPAARVSGRVTDGGGRPVPGASVCSGERGTFGSSSTSSGVDGRFTLVGLPAGAVRLSAQKPWTGSAAVSLVLRPGETLAWNPSLAPEARLFGTLRAPDGAPLAGLEVVAWVPVEGEPLQHATTTDEDGRFWFEDLPPKPHVLWVDGGQEFMPLVHRGVLPSLEPLELRLESVSAIAGTFLGRILGPQDRPLRSARFRARSVAGAEFDDSTEADAGTGAFELRVRAGRCRLSIEADGYAPRPLGEHDLALGERLDLGLLRLAEPAFVEGTITGIADEDLESLELLWLDAAQDWLAGGHRNQRAYRSPPLAPGKVDLIARGAFVEQLNLSFELDEGVRLARTLELRRAGLLTLVLELPPGVERPEHVWGELWDGSERQ